MVTIFVLKAKAYYEMKFMVTSEKALNPSKMVSDQNEKYTIGISMIEELFREIAVPLHEQQGKSIFCIGSTDRSPVFFFIFFFSRPA